MSAAEAPLPHTLMGWLPTTGSQRAALVVHVGLGGVLMLRSRVLGMENVRQHGGRRQAEEHVRQLARLLHDVIDQHARGRPRGYPWLVVEDQPVRQIVPLGAIG